MDIPGVNFNCMFNLLRSNNKLGKSQSYDDDFHIRFFFVNEHRLKH
jgi:hypothetical protein